MASFNLELVLNFLKPVLPTMATIFCVTWLIFECFKKDRETKLKSGYYMWSNLACIEKDEDLKKRIIKHMEIVEKELKENK